MDVWDQFHHRLTAAEKAVKRSMVNPTIPIYDVQIVDPREPDRVVLLQRLDSLASGLPADQLVAYVCDDDGSGNPNLGSVVCTTTPISLPAPAEATWYGVTATPNPFVYYSWMEFVFTTNPVLDPATAYHLVLERTGALNNSYYYTQFVMAASTQYVTGTELKYYNGSSWVSLGVAPSTGYLYDGALIYLDGNTPFGDPGPSALGTIYGGGVSINFGTTTVQKLAMKFYSS